MDMQDKIPDHGSTPLRYAPFRSTTRLELDLALMRYFPLPPPRPFGNILALLATMNIYVFSSCTKEIDSYTLKLEE